MTDRIQSTKGAEFPKFLVLGCNDFEIVDKAYTLPEATQRAQQQDACFVLKILRTKEGADLSVFSIEEAAAVPIPVRAPVPIKATPRREEPVPPSPVEVEVAVVEEVPSPPPEAPPSQFMRRRPPPVELL